MGCNRGRVCLRCCGQRLVFALLRSHKHRMHALNNQLGVERSSFAALGGRALLEGTLKDILSPPPHQLRAMHRQLLSKAMPLVSERR